MMIEGRPAAYLAMFYYDTIGPAVFHKDNKKIQDMREFVLEFMGLKPDTPLTEELVSESREKLAELFSGTDTILVSWMDDDEYDKIVDTFAETSDKELVIYVLNKGDLYTLACEKKEEVS